ncbi:MAG: hypothetical protein ACI4JW_08585 [Oscillospiraceae bacterium]
MAVDGRLNFDTKIDTKGFSKGVNSLGGQMSSLIGLAGKLAAALGAAFSVKTLITAATETSNALQGLQSIIIGQGRNFSKATKWVQEYISDGLIPLQNAVTAYKNLAARGYDDTQIQKVLTALKDSAAYGRQSSYSLGEAVQTATEGLKNENSILVDNAGVTKNVSKMWEEYASSIGTTSGKLTQEQKIQAEVNGILAETQYQTGDAAKIAGTFSGQISQLSFNINELKVSLGNVLTNILKPIVAYLNAAIKQITAFVDVSARLLGFTSITSSVSENTADLSSNADSAAQSYEDMAAAAEAAEKASENQLASFDKINKLGDSTDSTAGTNAALSPTTSSGGLQSNISVKADFDTSDAESKLTKLFKDIKKGFNKLFIPFKKAWSKDGKKVTDSLKYAFKEVFDLTKKISKSFGEVWTNGTGEKTVGYILRYFQNINVTIGNIARNLKQAWSEDNLGIDIIQNIADIFNTIIRHNENISKKISEWSEDLDFSPALTALRDLSAALEPFTDTIGDGLETFFDEVLLPLGKWTIEDLIPTFLETLADVITGLQKAWETAAPVIKDKLWDGFLKPIAEWTADVAISALESLGDGIKKIGECMTEKDVEVLIDLSGAVVAICAAAKAYKNVQKLSSSLESLKNKGSTASTTLKSWNQPLSTPASEGGTTFATKFCAAVAAFFAGWEIGMAIRDAIGGDKIDEALFPIFDGIVNFFTVTIPEWWDSTTWQDFIPIYNIFGDQIDGWLHPILDSIVQFFTVDIPGWWDTLQEDTLFPIYDKAVSAWESVVTFFTESIPTFFSETVPGWFSDLWESIKEIFKDCVDWWSTLFSDAWDGVTDAFSDFKKFFSDKWIDITTAFSDAASWLGDKFSKAWENIKTAFSLSSVSSFFGDIWDSIKSAFSSVGTWFEEIFSKAWQKVKDVFSTGGKIFSGIKDGISEVFTDTVNTIIDGLNIVIAAPFDAINDAIGWIRNLEIAGWNPFEDLSEISVPQIPKLATGTVVPANYGQFLAVLGDNKREAEIVSPLSTMKQALLEALVAYGGSGGNGQRMSLTIPITLNGRVISQIVIDDINEYIRRNGRSPIRA